MTMDPEALREVSATTLRRLEQNFRKLRSLTVGRSEHPYMSRSIHDSEFYGQFWPNDGADLSRLGVAIGNNTHLMELKFDEYGIAELKRIDDRERRAFLDGLERNTSITHLSLLGGSLSGVKRRSLLGPDAPSLGGFSEFVKAVLSSCTNLKCLDVYALDVNYGIGVEDIVSGIRGLTQLEELTLQGYRYRGGFGKAGCESLATLLEGTRPNLKKLYLSSENIDDEFAIILSNSLKGNETLQRLEFYDHSISKSGWQAFANVLSTSNHTLVNIGPRYGSGRASVPDSLASLLSLNSDPNKDLVAIKKVQRYEWDSSMLPLVLSWLGSSDGCVQNNEDNGGERKLSLIYGFIKASPDRWMVTQEPQCATVGKRKRGADDSR